MRALLVSALVLAAMPAAADEGIGVYGRFDHDLGLSLGAGGGVRVSRVETRAMTLVEGRALYLQSAGIVVAGAFAPGADRELDGSVAVELRPLFIILLTQNRFSGDAFFDIAATSVGIESGIAWDGARPAFLVGLGTELPILRSRDSGLFLRVGLRLYERRTRWTLGDDAGPELTAAASLQMHGGVSAGIL